MYLYKTELFEIELFDHLTECKLITVVMVIIKGNGHSDTSSNPGWHWLHFT